MCSLVCSRCSHQLLCVCCVRVCVCLCVCGVCLCVCVCGMCLCVGVVHSSGRACQVKGEGQLDWVTFRTDSPLKSGDVIGCGWVRQEGGASGKVYFTVNGHKLEQEFLAVPAEMFPFVHIQKKVCVWREWRERSGYVEGVE